jgi:rhomboid protease GluP
MTYPSYDPPAAPEEQPPRQARLRMSADRPIVTYTILGLTVFVFVLQQLAGNEAVASVLMPLVELTLNPRVEAALRARDLYDQMLELMRSGVLSNLVVLLGSKVNPLIAVGQVWRLFTPALLHASVMHIGFNMYALYSFGTFLEPAYGRTRFLVLYLLAAFGGNVLSFLLSAGVSVGASTAVFGLVGAQGVFFFHNRAIFGAQARSILTNLVVIVVFNLVLGLSPGIDNWGHMGGLLAGLAFAWFAGPLLTISGLWPDFHLEDQRSSGLVWTTALLLVLTLSALAVFGISAR